MNMRRVSLGVVIWIALLAASVGLLRQSSIAKAAEQWASQILQYSMEGRASFALAPTDRIPFADGDPIFFQEPSGEIRLVGQVTVVPATEVSGQSRDGDRSARAELFSNAPQLSGANWELESHTSSNSFGWILATLLPPEKRERVADELAETFRSQVESLYPEVQAAVSEAMGVVYPEFERQLSVAVKDHESQIEALVNKYRGEMVASDVPNLVENVLWPIVRKRAEPTANEVGLEIWERVSLWRFGWRYVFDTTPLGGDLTEREWKRFLEQEIVPILKEHSDEFLDVGYEVVRDTVSDPQVQASLRRGVERVIQDPQAKELVASILKQAVIDNPELHQRLAEAWQSPSTQRALAIAGERLEPTVRKVAEMIVGNESEGISPEFAAVLRSGILQKDRRWLLLKRTSPGVGVSSGNVQNSAPVLKVRRAATSEPYPVPMREGSTDA